VRLATRDRRPERCNEPAAHTRRAGALRWYNHIASFSAAKLNSLPDAVDPVPVKAKAAAPAKAQEAKAEAPKEAKKEKAPPPAKKAEPTAEEKAAAAAAKLLGKVIKEGGKKGVEIEGAADMGGQNNISICIQLYIYI